MTSDPVSTAHITVQTTLKPAIRVWQVYLVDQANSPHTVKAFTADLNLLANYLPPDRTLGAITTQDLNNFLHWLQTGRGVSCSPKTLSRRITSLKAFFRWLTKFGILILDPAERVIQHSVISPLPVVLTPDEVSDALDVAEKYRRDKKPDARYLTLFSLLLHTGIKKNETLALSPNHVDENAPGGPILFIRYASPQHRYKERKINIADNWIEVYHEYRSQYSLSDRLFPWSQRRLEYLLEDLGEEAGLEKHISFDMCRWTCALSDWQSGMEPNHIRQKLGVSKIQWREIRMKLIQLGGEHPGTSDDEIDGED